MGQTQAVCTICLLVPTGPGRRHQDNWGYTVVSVHVSARNQTGESSGRAAGPANCGALSPAPMCVVSYLNLCPGLGTKNGLYRLFFF